MTPSSNNGIVRRLVHYVANYFPYLYTCQLVGITWVPLPDPGGPRRMALIPGTPDPSDSAGAFFGTGAMSYIRRKYSKCDANRLVIVYDLYRNGFQLEVKSVIWMRVPESKLGRLAREGTHSVKY